MWKEKYLEGVFSELDDSTNIKEYEETLKKLPQKVYKYLAFNNEYAFKNLENNILACSRPKDFNDPYDCAIFMNIKNILNQDENYRTIKRNFELAIDRMKNSPLFDSFKEQILKKQNVDVNDFSLDDFEFDKDVIKSKNKAIESIKNKISIGCLSEKNDSILMWSHYAYNHSGFCIEYDFNQLQNTVGYILPVIYKTNPSSLDICKAKSNDGLAKIMPFLIKAEEWHYEQEWRIIKTDMKFCEERRIIEMPKPTAIYMGCKIDEKNEKRLKEFCLRKKIQLYKKQMKEDSFVLESLRII